MRSWVEWLKREGYRLGATLRVDEREQFAFDYGPEIRYAKHVVYVVVQAGRDRPVYVGQAQDLRARYGFHHVRWLRGEKGNSESQRLRWVEIVRQGPVEFYFKVVDGSLAVEEWRLIYELDPELNMTGTRRAAQLAAE